LEAELKLAILLPLTIAGAGLAQQIQFEAVPQEVIESRLKTFRQKIPNGSKPWAAYSSKPVVLRRPSRK
jgi:hypothetical protein